MTKTTSSRDERLSSSAHNSRELISAEQQSAEANEATVQSTVQQPSGSLQIIHATTGRVRIRATDGNHNSILDTICQNLRQQDGVKEVLANQQIGSLVVKFDENQLSLPQMLAILHQFGIHASESPQAVSQSDPFAAWKSLDFWKEQGISFIPLITGLAVTGRLGIHGLAAIPVYMITADATRRVIDYLEPQVSAAVEQQSRGTGGDEGVISSSSSPTLPHSSAQPTEIAYSVIHAIGGRIRFNVPRIAQDSAYAQRLERLIKTDPQVTSVRVNCDAASAAIAYKPSDLPISHWVSLMHLADKTIPQTIPIKTTTEKPLPDQVSQPAEPREFTTETEEPIETANLWSNFKPPALWAVLVYMAKFPLDPVAD